MLELWHRNFLDRISQDKNSNQPTIQPHEAASAGGRLQ
jgi:hypothetical protein